MVKQNWSDMYGKRITPLKSMWSNQNAIGIESFLKQPAHNSSAKVLIDCPKDKNSNDHGTLHTEQRNLKTMLEDNSGDQTTHHLCWKCFQEEKADQKTFKRVSPITYGALKTIYSETNEISYQDLGNRRLGSLDLKTIDFELSCTHKINIYAIQNVNEKEFDGKIGNESDFHKEFCLTCKKLEESKVLLKNQHPELEPFYSNKNKIPWAEMPIPGHMGDVLIWNCPEHAEYETNHDGQVFEYEQTLTDKLRGRQCKACKHSKFVLPEEALGSKEEFMVLWSKENTLDPFKLRTGSMEIALWECSEHGPYRQRIKDHCRKGYGCPDCHSYKGEVAVGDSLTALGVKYLTHVRKNVTSSKVGIFDFKLESTYSIYIEYDGIQHFAEGDHFGGAEGWKERQVSDLRKNCWILRNKLSLFRIKTPHQNLDSIKAFLKHCIQRVENGESGIFVSHIDYIDMMKKVTDTMGNGVKELVHFVDIEQ